MKNKIIMIIILFCICIIVGVVFLLSKKDNEKQNTYNNQIKNNNINVNNENYTNTSDIESENNVISEIKVIIDGKKYNAVIEKNETAQGFANMLPAEYNMSELNGNEKYFYLDNTLPTNPYKPQHIESGDIMLYGNNCLVVFYKSFDTSYSYTKIGHIDDLSNIGNEQIIIKFEK